MLTPYDFSNFCPRGNKPQMSLEETSQYPAEKFLIAFALILVFATTLAAASRPVFIDGETCPGTVVIPWVLFIAAAVGKFVSGRAAFLEGIGLVTGFNTKYTGKAGLVFSQAASRTCAWGFLLTAFFSDDRNGYACHARRSAASDRFSLNG